MCVFPITTMTGDGLWVRRYLKAMKCQERKISETDLAYLAGILDADGHIGLVRRKRSGKRDTQRTHYLRPVVQIGQAKMPLLEHIKSVVGVGAIVTNERGRVFHNLRFWPGVLLWLLPVLIPHLVVKRRQAEIVLQFIQDLKYRGKELSAEIFLRRELLAEECRRLNTKPKTLRDRLERSGQLTP